MKKSVMIQLDKIRNLRYGMNALVTIEELTGKSITKIDLSDISMKTLGQYCLRVLLGQGIDAGFGDCRRNGNLSEIAKSLRGVQPAFGDDGTAEWQPGKPAL